MVKNDIRIHQSPSWGGGWRSGWDRPSGITVNLNFGFYLNDRFSTPCYVSPWYYYSSCPPYIPASKCIVVPNYSCDWNVGSNYNWNVDRSYSQTKELDTAIADIQASYVDNNLSAVDGLVPPYGEVAISTEGHYDYSLSSDDFRQMFFDSVRSTQTTSFHVESVRRDGDFATVSCSHEVVTPDGGTERVYQTYRLRNEEGRFVVTDFMTSHSAEY